MPEPSFHPVADHDYYRALGVASSATRDEISHAFRRLAMRWHPDRHPGRAAQVEEVFKLVQQAYAVLKDADRRSAYDAARAEALAENATTAHAGKDAAGAAAHPSTASASQAGAARPAHAAPGTPQQGADLRCEAAIALETAVSGGKVTVRVRETVPCLRCDGAGRVTHPCAGCSGKGAVTRGYFRQARPCRACHGDGEASAHCHDCAGLGTLRVDKVFHVAVTPGVRDGTVLRARGQGGPGLDGGAPGDLLCTLRIKRDRVFGVDGLHLTRELRIDFVTACLGGTVPVMRFHKSLTVVVPAMTRAGTVLRVARMGLHDRAARHSGDLLLKVVIDLPGGMRQPDPAQRDLLRSLVRASR